MDRSSQHILRSYLLDSVRVGDGLPVELRVEALARVSESAQIWVHGGSVYLFVDGSDEGGS